MIQHPPLPYVATAGALSALDGVLGLDGRSFDVELLALRLVHVLVTSTACLFIMMAARRLQLRPWAQVAAALLPLTVPQLFHVTSSVGNDGWLVAASAAAAVGLAAVVSGDERPRTAALVGLAVGVASLTKAFGLLLVGAVVLAYALAFGARRVRTAVARAALAVAVAVVVAGWWWIGNVVRTGSVQPHGAPLRSQAAPPGFHPERLDWYRRFAAWTAVRYWGWFGEFSRGQRIPVGLVVVATGVAVVLVVAALRSGRAPVVRFAIVAVALHVAAFVVVGREARALYLDTGLLNGIQGRYLYVALPALAVASAAGAEGLLADRPRARMLAGVGLLAAVITMQAAAVRAVLRGSWGAVGSSMGAGVAAMRVWAPVRGLTIVLLGLLAVAVAAGVGALLSTGPVPEPEA